MDKARLIDTMSQHGISVKQLSERAGVSQQAISGFLRTGRKPRVETTMRLARALGVKPSFLMDLD